MYKGEYEVAGQKIVVACKKLHDEEKSSTEEFMMEARAMATLDHPRVLEFVGIFFDKVYHARPTILVTKFMLHGDLANYLRDPSTHIILAQIFNFCLEAAEGMQYVHSKGIIHRDLAARNCM